jgi:hypothetical protein
MHCSIEAEPSLNKYVSAIVIGVVTGLAGGILIKMFVFPVGDEPYFYGAGIAVFFAYILANLAGNRKVAAASETEREEALAMQPPPGKALLIPYREGYVAKLAGMNLALDGQEFVQLTAPKFACLVVTPGRHTLTAAFGGLAGPQSKNAGLEFDLLAGGVAVIRIQARIGALQGKIAFTPETDLAMAKNKLQRMPMAAANPAAI